MAQSTTGEKHVVIVGGGTAGWLSACYLVSRLAGDAKPKPRLTLIESSDVPPIGVGEATVPSLRDTIAALGVDEYTFMRECDATFKHGIRFVQWCHAPGEKPGEHYFHPFERPLKAGFDSLAGYWLNGKDPHAREFFDAVSVQQRVAAACLAPKRFEDRSYAGPMPYAYHLDAGKLAGFLKRLGIARGVRHVIGNVTGIEATAQGDIGRLLLDDSRSIAGDVFIDCSGFLGLLIEKHYSATFNDLSHILFCDKAVACQVPNAEQNQQIRPYTTATAQTAGWIWDIGLKNRRGTGHVFSSRYMSADEAEAVLRDYIGPQTADLKYRTLDMKVGYRDQHWVGNCVAVGLSGGFIEPLESTGIHLIEVALNMLVQMLPRYFNGGSPHARFNEIMRNHYDIVIDFVKLHYYLTSRSDSPFWIDNAAAESATPELAEKVEAWRSGYPDVYDMRFIHSIFDHMSYQYILFGMGRRPGHSANLGGNNHAVADNIFRNTYAAYDKAVEVLPDHRQIIERIHEAR